MKHLPLWLLLCMSSSMPAQQTRKEALGLGYYSSCSTDAHRSSGISITVIESNSGYWVLFQSFEGFAHDPLLIKAAYDGSVLSFTVPDIKDQAGPGSFRGYAGPKELTGKFDRSPSEIVRIPKIGHYH